MKKNSKKEVTTESNKPDSQTKHVLEQVRNLATGMNTWSPYFPIRVELGRRDMRLVIAAIAGTRREMRDGKLNIDKEMFESYDILLRDIDSALKFRRDEDFVLITKAEYDKLTQPKA